MEDSSQLWERIKAEYPAQSARVASHVAPVAGPAQVFLDRLRDLWASVSIASDKCGTVGNPYEQASDDLELLLCAAERISGLSSRPRSERPNYSLKRTNQSLRD